ncbi:MAG: hypothetical protein WA773_22415, partial [Bradyrhizobium sp.]
GYQAFPQGAKAGTPVALQTGPKAYNCGINWAHTATIPTKRPIDANAAASSTKTFNMAASVMRT